MSWTNFNDAQDQQVFTVIPKGTLAKVRMTLRPGGYDDPSREWSGGYATCNNTTGAIYLKAEFVVLEGDYARQKIWSLIGLHSNKGPEWANMGRAFVKGVLNSARGLHPGDETDKAKTARCIHDLSELDGIEFVAKIDVEKDSNGDQRNVIKTAITPDHKEYQRLMGLAVQALPAKDPFSSPSAPAAPPAPSSMSRPSWAQ